MLTYSTTVVVRPLTFIPFFLVSITVSHDVLKLTGTSVQFDIRSQGHQFDEIFWTFNENNTILLYYEEHRAARLYSAYQGRVEFNVEIHSLILRNLRKNDSGLYKAIATGKQHIELAEYRLSVLDSVETPVLTPVPQPQSNGTCNITLTCRGHDRSITTSCYNEGCEEKEVTSWADFALSLSVKGSYVICNHSNPVSWKNISLEMNQIKRFCYHEENRNQGKRFDLAWPGPVLGSVVVVIILIGLFIVYKRLHKKNKTGSLQFDTAVTAAPNKDESPTALRILGKPDPPSTVYSTVQKSVQPPRSDNHQNTSNPEMIIGQREVRLGSAGRLQITFHGTLGCSSPETIYATVKKTRDPAHDT